MQNSSIVTNVKITNPKSSLRKRIRRRHQDWRKQYELIICSKSVQKRIQTRTNSRNAGNKPGTSHGVD